MDKRHYRLELVKVAKSGNSSEIKYQQIFLLDEKEAQRLIRVIKETLKEAKLDEETLISKQIKEREKK